MDFYSLRPGVYVKYNPSLRITNWRLRLSDSQLWEDEPINCILVVDTIFSLGEDGELAVQLECTSGCDGHQFACLTQREYENYSKELSGPIFFVASMTDAIVAIEEKERVSEQFDLEEETKFFEELITR